MIEVRKLADCFVAHAAKLRSAPIVCCVRVAAESWFRVELVPALIDSGFSLEGISFDFTHPGTTKKADLLVETPKYISVLELKSFVSGADANNIRDFPAQLQRLMSLVRSEQITQGVAFCTFMGYGTRRLSTLLSKFFSDSWERSRPTEILPDTPLKLVLASCSKQGLTTPKV